MTEDEIHRMFYGKGTAWGAEHLRALSAFHANDWVPKEPPEYRRSAAVITTQDGYDWPNQHPTQPQLIWITAGGTLILAPPPALVDSGMSFNGVPLLRDASFDQPG
jgi:hypothetical protein